MGGADANGVVDGAAHLTAAFAAADVHPLLCAVAHRTGDLSLLRDELAPDQEQLLVPGRGLGPDRRPRRAGGPQAALSAHSGFGPARPRPGAHERRGSSPSWSAPMRRSTGTAS